MAIGFKTIEPPRQTTLSLALSLVDHFTGKAGVVGDTRVTIQPAGRPGFLNPSGYYLFTDVKETVFSVSIRNAFYLDRDLSVDTEALDPRLPLISTVLYPRYVYPFPPGSTLITGRVIDDDQQPLAGADLAVAHSSSANTSGRDGRFALYLKGLTEDDILLENGRRLIEINGGTTLQLTAQRSGFQGRNISIGPLEEATTLLIREPIVLTPA